MRPIVTDVARSVVCIPVCILVTRLNRSRYSLERLTSMGPRNHYQMGSTLPEGRGNLRGCQAHWKAFGVSMLRCTQQEGSFNPQQRYDSRLQCSRLVGVTLRCLPVKNPSLAMRPFVKVLWPLFKFHCIAGDCTMPVQTYVSRLLFYMFPGLMI